MASVNGSKHRGRTILSFFGPSAPKKSKSSNRTSEDNTIEHDIADIVSQPSTSSETQQPKTENPCTLARIGSKMSKYDFIATTYLLMDILPIVSELCLVFQKSDLDVSMVQVSVDHCKTALNKMKSGEVEHHTYLHQLQNEHLTVEKGKLTFKGNHAVQGKQNIDSIRQKFVDAILEKIDLRFPDDDSSFMYSFGVLAMRPVSFCSEDELKTWGNDKLESLISQYGESKMSKPLKGKVDAIATAEPIINAESTRHEWSMVKPFVIKACYPRDNMANLWALINMYHREEFPNLLILASLALTAPIHTADCERGFSAQNQVKTAARNRLSSVRLDDILMVKFEDGPVDQFDYGSALTHWRTSKARKMFVADRSK